METAYIDFLLVERKDGTAALVISESHCADVGSIIEFNNGEMGRVVKKAWGDKRDGELHDLIVSLVPTYEAEAVYQCYWKKEADDGTVPGDS